MILIGLDFQVDIFPYKKNLDKGLSRFFLVSATDYIFVDGRVFAMLCQPRMAEISSSLSIFSFAYLFMV